MNDSPMVTIYSDGACTGNPGPGGWAAILRYGGHEKTISGGEVHTTNNRMELTAAVQALSALKQPCRVNFYTDSQYLKQGVEEWLLGWKARGWKRKGGQLANLELWQQLDALVTRHQVAWHWVRGHSGQPENERVDRLARAAIPQKR